MSKNKKKKSGHPGILYTVITMDPEKPILTIVLDNQLQTITSADPDQHRLIQLLEMINSPWAEKKSQRKAWIRELRELLLPIGTRIVKRLSEVTDRVTYDEYLAALLLDGTPVENYLGKHLLSQLYAKADNKEITSLVRFLEKLELNPSHRSRELLYGWLERYGLELTENGSFIAYKGLTNEDHSVHAGTASVNGVSITGTIPHAIGDVITMPRRDISDDPNHACRAGLHAGSRAFALAFAEDRIATVLINPAHVVCIPSDSESAKMRVQEYLVLDIQDKSSHSNRQGGSTVGW